MPDSVDLLDPVMRLPNLALASLAASLPDHDIRILDLLLVKENLKESLYSHLDSFQPDIVGMTAMTFQFPSLTRIAAAIRRKLPEAVLVAGGYHVTLMHREICEETPDIQLDFMVRGEGEITFPELVKAISERKMNHEAIDGLTWRDDSGMWRHNLPRALLDLGDLPLPDRNIRVERKFHLFGELIDVAETSRGCPLLCNFCSIRQMYGQTLRKFPIPRIVEDLTRLKAAGARVVFLVDDNITYDAEHFKSVCRAIIDNGLNSMEYAIQASAHGIAKNPDLVELMERANFRLIVLGLESMDPSSIKFLKKATSIEINLESVRLLKAHKMAVIALFIIGLPDDTKETIHNNFSNIMKLKPDALYCQFLSPYPKTEIREQLLAEGLVVNPHDFSSYDGYHCNVRTRHLSQEELWDIFTRENIKTWWGQIKNGNYLLKRFFRGYVICELKVIGLFFYRLFTGKSKDWKMEI